MTAPGGGAGVMPFITTYAAVPLTIGATVLYTYASHFISHKRLFTVTVGIFAVFNLLFAMCIFPNHEALHLPGVAENLAKVLPSGLSGAVGMIRNWTFSVFYCLSELWGDMGITLLFWSFANEITSSKQAHIVYPMMGVGANVAQTLGGIVLRLYSVGGAAAAYSSRSQTLLFQIVGCMVVVIGIHHFIASQTEQKKKQAEVQSSTPERHSVELRKPSKKLLAIGGSSETNESTWETHDAGYVSGVCASIRPKSFHSTSYSIFQQRGRVMSAEFRKVDEPVDVLAKMPLISVPDKSTAGTRPVTKQEQAKDSKEKPTFMESVKTLKDSPVVRSLGIITIAQALSVTLLEFMWRSHLRLMCPTPAAFQACLGDIATATGLITGAMMFLSPILFTKIGWKGVANLTPVLMTFGGCAFFALCSAFHVTGQLGMTAIAQQILPFTAIAGSVLYVLSRGSKFSLFKPSQEMVYIKMDESQRTKGKAAVDVIGANVGKSGASLLQQALLVASGGHLLFATPVMFAVYTSMMQGWNRAVGTLATFQKEPLELESRPLTEKEIDEEEEEPVGTIGARNGESGSSLCPATHRGAGSDIGHKKTNSAVEFSVHSSPATTRTNTNLPPNSATV